MVRSVRRRYPIKSANIFTTENRSYEGQTWGGENPPPLRAVRLPLAKISIAIPGSKILSPFECATRRKILGETTSLPQRIEAIYNRHNYMDRMRVAVQNFEAWFSDLIKPHLADHVRTW
jgi:hypothetical protein